MGGMPINATWDQDSFRFRNDDGNETAATWMAAANTTPADIALDTNFRLRFLVQETAGSNQSETPSFLLQYRADQGSGFGSWTDINPSNLVRNTLSIHFSSSVAATQQIGSGTLTGGQLVEGLATSGGVNATVGSDEYELEFTCDCSSANGATEGDIYEFRLLVQDGIQNTSMTAFDVNGGSYTRYPSVTVAVSGFTITADSGSYSISGTAANLQQGYEVVADGGSYAINGTNATISKGQTLTADGGSYAISGTDATLFYNQEIAAESGSYSIGGTDANLEYSYRIDAESGSYSIFGTDANLEHGYVVGAESGSYSISGSDATLTYTPIGGYTIVAEAGSYSYGGADAQLEIGYTVEAEAGSYVIAGTDATLTYSGDIEEPSKRGGDRGGYQEKSKAYKKRNQQSYADAVNLILARREEIERKDVEKVVSAPIARKIRQKAQAKIKGDLGIKDIGPFTRQVDLQSIMVNTVLTQPSVRPDNAIDKIMSEYIQRLVEAQQAQLMRDEADIELLIVRGYI